MAKRALRRTRKQALRGLHFEEGESQQASKQVCKQVSKQASRQALRGHSVGAMPCRCLFFEGFPFSACARLRGHQNLKISSKEQKDWMLKYEGIQI